MLLVIFGAGASYDSVPHLLPGKTLYELQRPPLANELFADRPTFVAGMDLFPDCKALIPRLRQQGVAVERELARFREEGKIFPQRYCQLAAIQYYLHYVLWECQVEWYARHRGITNYRTLLDEIERWRFERKEKVCFVTFNYDTMLEEAMASELHLSRPHIDAYIAWENYFLVKLHGSMDWGREIDGMSSSYNSDQQLLIRQVVELKISNRYRLVTQHPMLKEGDAVVFPALSIPLEKKDEFSCPETHVRTLETLLPKVSKIVTIGWRATELDFLNMLRHKVPRGLDMMVVSGTAHGVTETAGNLSLAPFSPQLLRSVENGFSGLVLEHLDTLAGFLRKPVPVV